MTGDSDLAGFSGMVELPMAASLGYLIPAVLLYQPDHVADLHTGLLASHRKVTAGVLVGGMSSAKQHPSFENFGTGVGLNWSA